MKSVRPERLISGMLLEEDIRNSAGALIAPKWIRLTAPIIRRLERFLDRQNVSRPLAVLQRFRELERKGSTMRRKTKVIWPPRCRIGNTSSRPSRKRLTAT